VIWFGFVPRRIAAESVRELNRPVARSRPAVLDDDPAPLATAVGETVADTCNSPSGDL